MAAEFGDLRMRMATGLAMAALGLGAVWLGGLWFIGLVLLLAGLLIWELAMMLGAQRLYAAAVGAGAIACLSFAHSLPLIIGLPVLILPAVAGVVFLRGQFGLFLPFALAIMLAAFGMIVHRDSFGFGWMVWLVAVVMASDIAGYFAGRIIGGPKFWPRVSPKKTWSGTIAGWLGAIAVSLPFIGHQGAGALGLMVLAVILALAAQMGDLAESALKRHVGVKDSSHLLPGHGGVYDRFDGMIGAALVLFFIESLGRFPPQ